MTEAVPPFRTFVERLQDMTRTVIVRNSSKHGGLTLPAYLHFAMPDGQHDTQHVGMAGSAEDRRELVRTAVVPLVKALGPEIVGWTFEGAMDDVSVAVVVVIDRERAETYYAPLARAMGQTLMGEWLPWPPNQQAGTFVTPIQEALR
jgi:hypothetical protein